MSAGPGDVPDDEIGPARKKPAGPRRIGGYTIVDVLGQGGMGQVYLARQDSLDRLVAIKVLRAELSKDAVYLERFQREARAAAMFQHPHVVSVIDTGRDEKTGEHYIAFEHVEGGSLEGLVKAAGQLPERRSLEITRAIALALVFAESKGLVHRDMKPANILLARDGTPKLADLGLVRSADPDPERPGVTQEGIVLGTPLYMAPEQALGRGRVDVRADIYALGLVLYRMVTGRMPFNESEDTCSTLAILSRHVNEELPALRAICPDVSVGLEKLVADMTAREVERRYQSAGHVAQDIERILAGQEPIGARARLATPETDAPTTAASALRPDDLLPARPASERLPKAAPAAAPAPAAAGSPPAPAPHAPSPHAVTRPTPALGVAPAAGPKADAAARPPSGRQVETADDLAKAARDLARAQSARPEPGRIPVAGVLGLAIAGIAIGAWALRPDPTAKVPDPPPITKTDPIIAPPVAPPPADPTPPVEAPPVETPPVEPMPVEPPPVDPSPIDPPVGPIDPPPPPVEPTPPAVEPTPPPAPEPDPVADAIRAAQGDPERVASAVRVLGRELFTDARRGVDHLQLMASSSGWRDESPMRDRYFTAMEAVILALEPALAWDERERRLVALEAITRERGRAPMGATLARAIDAELQHWNAFAQGVQRVCRALGAPHSEAQALDALTTLPQDRNVAEDARALFALAFATDQPEKWSRLEARRKDVRAGLAIARGRIPRSAIGVVLHDELEAIIAVLSRQLDDPEGSATAAGWAAWTAEPRARETLYLSARVQEVLRDGPRTNLIGRGLVVELDAPPSGSSGVTVTLDPTAATPIPVRLDGRTLVIAAVPFPIASRAGRTLIIEPRVTSATTGGRMRADKLLIRIPGADPAELLAVAEVVSPVRFSVQTQGAASISRIAVTRVPARAAGPDPAPIRGH